jgi:phospho-N-acetylmuramoyl-pentapeptide-transferase
MLSLMESGGVGFLLALLLTPFWMRFVQARAFGHQVSEYVSTHQHKSGIPTMGGVVIVFAAVMGYAMGHIGTSVVFTRSGILAVLVTVASSLLGFLDDFLAIRNERNLGLNKRGKFVGQLAIAIVFAVLAINWVHTSANLSFTRYSLPGWNLTATGWIIFAVFIIVATSNAVNLTDGLDGLAIVPVMIAAASFGMIAYLSGNAVFADYLQIHYVAGTGELAVLCGAVLGAGLGFLWFNAPPASIFMGDTGSLALGGMLGSIAVAVKHEIVLGVIGGLFVLEAVSVIVQVVSFKLTGKRVFRMAPLHHHFEQKGWTEPQIVIRFWIISVMLALAGLSTLKLR